MVPQPTSFHTASTVTRTMNVSGLVITFHGCIPASRMLWASSPAPPSIATKNVTTSTQLKKCGR